jgi:hypothetical protein
MKHIITLTCISVLSMSCTREEKTEVGTTAEATAPKPYPLGTCLVSGEELGSMGEPVVIIHEGREIKFCCDSCIPKFNRDPEKYLSELDARAAE